MTRPAARPLNDVMEFDHPVRVHPDGTVTDAGEGIYAPTLCDDQLDGDAWELFTAGYSGQDRYSGPIMHDSEYIGGGLERDILAAPGVYVAIVSSYSTGPDGEEAGDTDTEDYVEGWAVARLKGSES